MVLNHRKMTVFPSSDLPTHLPSAVSHSKCTPQIHCHLATFLHSITEVFSVRDAVPGAFLPQSHKESICLFCFHALNIRPLSFSKRGAVLLVFHYFNSLSVRMIHIWMFKSSLQKCKLCFWDCLYIWNANNIGDKTVSGPCIGMLDCQAQFLWNFPAKIFNKNNNNRKNCSEVQSMPVIECT